MTYRTLIRGGLVAWLLATCAPAQEGGISTPGRMAPSPKSKTVDVLRGESTRILLEAAASSRRRLMFKVRAATSGGSLTSPVDHPELDNAAVITYTPPVSAKVVDDFFTYAVKEPGGIFSPAATVRIRIIDPAPVLELPKAVHFDRIPLGESSLKTITIRNIGTDDYRQRIVFPKPWTLVRNDPVLAVPAGGQVRILVAFAPGEADSYYKEFQFQPGIGGAVVKISGVAFAPVDLDPKRIELKWDGERNRRTGKIVAVNQMKSELTVEVGTDDRLWSEPEVTIPTQGRKEIVFSIPVTDKDKYEGEAVIRAMNHEQRIQVSAAVVPAVIALTEPAEGDEGLEFNLKKGEEKAEQTITLKNIGGQTAFVYGEIERPFELKEGATSRRLDSGEELSYTVVVDTANAGEFNRKLKILGGPESIRIPLHAIIFEGKTVRQYEAPEKTAPVAGSKRGAPIPAKAGPAGASELMTLQDVMAKMQQKARDFAGTRVRDEIFDESIPSVPAIFLKDSTMETLTLWWPHPVKGKKYFYVIETEVRRIDEVTKMPFPDWYRFSDNVKMTSDEKGVTAVISRLQPATQMTIRILTKFEGNYSKPSGMFRFSTTHKPRSWFRWWMIPVGILVGVGAIRLKNWMASNGILFEKSEAYS